MILLRFEHSYWSLVTAYDKLESVGHFHVILILCKVHSCQAGTDIKLLSLSDVLHKSEVSCFQGCKRVIHQVSATKTEVIRSLSLKFLEGNEMFFSNVSRMTPYPSIHLWAASNLVERYQQIKRNSVIVTKLNEYLDFEEVNLVTLCYEIFCTNYLIKPNTLSTSYHFSLSTIQCLPLNSVSSVQFPINFLWSLCWPLWCPVPDDLFQAFPLFTLYWAAKKKLNWCRD